MEIGSNKSLFTLIAVVIFGIFLSLSYWLFQDEMKSVLATVMNKTAQSTNTKLIYVTEATIVENGFTVSNNYDGTCTIIDYDISNGLDVTIPNSVGGLIVTTIGGKAFYNKGIKSVVLPTTLTKIEDGYQEYVSPSLGYEYNEIAWGAFMKNNLTQIPIPESVTYIGDVAFSGNNLTTLALPSNLTYLGHRSFSVNKIYSLTLPSGIDKIYAFTFARNLLTTVTVPKSVMSIESNAFANNINDLNKNLLTSVLVPTSTSLQSNSFPSTTLITRY